MAFSPAFTISELEPLFYREHSFSRTSRCDGSRAPSRMRRVEFSEVPRPLIAVFVLSDSSHTQCPMKNYADAAKIAPIDCYEADGK